VAQGRALVERLHTQSMTQERLERQGNKCLTWRMLRSLQAVFEATALHGGTMVTAAPFFDTAKRGQIVFWGNVSEPEVVLWDSLHEEDRQSWKRAHQTSRDYVLVRRKPLIQRFVKEVEVITVEHESSMQTMWEHETIKRYMLMEGAGGCGMGSTRREATQPARIQEEEPGRRRGAPRCSGCRRERRK